MYINILGRQPSLGIAELEQLYGDVAWFSDESAIVNKSEINFERLGGSQKSGRVVAELSSGDWRSVSQKITQAYGQAWANTEGKITLGISAYGFPVSARDVQKTGIILKSKLKQSNVSLRLIPNANPALNTATSHHNKLGLSDKKVELLVVKGNKGKIVIAESIGSQNITAYAKRDQGRPKRDAFVGMLPPKLAQIMINLAQSPNPTASANRQTLLDPFCGTGVLLQEAALIGYDVYGTDLSEKMILYSDENLNWLKSSHRVKFEQRLHEGDAMKTTWQKPIDAVACETYLGQPFSAPPSPQKLKEVVKNCNYIISTFLKNLSPQLESGTPICLAVPAWKSKDGSFTYLPITGKLGELGYRQISLETVRSNELLYYREDQVVARELILLTKI